MPLSSQRKPRRQRRDAVSFGVRLRARLRFLLYAFRVMGSRLLIVALLTVGGGAIFHQYGQGADFVDSCYQVYAQLFFEHTDALPPGAVLRVLYFIIPLIGALVLAEGLLKVGASFLNFQEHRETYQRMVADSMQDHVVLVGLGNVGFRVLSELLVRKEQVVVIETTEHGQFVDSARARGVCLITGDARQEGLMELTGLDRAKAIIACTDNDLVNLEVSVDARRLNPDIRVVMRMFDQDLAGKLDNALSLGHSLSTSALAAPIFAAAALDSAVHGAYRIGRTLFIAVEVDAARFVGAAVTAAEAGLGVPVVGIRHGTSSPVAIADKTHVLTASDKLICHVAADALDALRDRASALEA